MLKKVQIITARGKMNHLIEGNNTACGIAIDLESAKQVSWKGSSDANDLVNYPNHCKACVKLLK